MGQQLTIVALRKLGPDADAETATDAVGGLSAGDLARGHRVVCRHGLPRPRDSPLRGAQTPEQREGLLPERALQTTKRSGKIVVSFTIAPTGLVISSSVKGHLVPTDLTGRPSM